MSMTNRWGERVVMRRLRVDGEVGKLIREFLAVKLRDQAGLSFDELASVFGFSHQTMATIYRKTPEDRRHFYQQRDLSGLLETLGRGSA